MKKILALALAMAMSLSLAACGGGDKGGSSAAGPGSDGSSSAAPGGDSSGSSSSIKVGAIYITSQNDVAGYTYQHHNGITSAMEALGMVVSDVCARNDIPYHYGPGTLTYVGCVLIE